MVRNAKSRGNYPVSWCKRMEDDCVGDCYDCWKECNFKLMEEVNEKPKEPNHTTGVINKRK